MLEISIPGWIWYFASDVYPLCVCQELKAVLPVSAPVRVTELIISGYHIPALVVLLYVFLVMVNPNWWCDLDLMNK